MPTPSYTPQQAINLVQQFAHGVPLTGTEANICDMVNSWMWTQYPWSWSIASLTPITLTDGVQDYTPTNTDILRPLRFQIARTDTTPMEVRELSLLANLSIELTRRGGLDMNTACGFYAGPNFIRLMYAASVGPNQTLQLQGQYQKTPTRITDATMTNPFPFDDNYFSVFVEGIKYYIYKLSDDPRAGTIQMSKNGRFQQVFTGQLGIFMYHLNYMASREELQTGDQFQFPETGLGQGRSYWPGLFGL